MEKPTVTASVMWMVQFCKDGRWVQGDEDYTEADAQERKARCEARRPEATFRIIKRTSIRMDEVVG